jgi:hypothetical protein
MGELELVKVVEGLVFPICRMRLLLVSLTYKIPLVLLIVIPAGNKKLELSAFPSIKVPFPFQAQVVTVAVAKTI